MAAMQRARMDTSWLTVSIGAHVIATHCERRGRRGRSGPEQRQRTPPPQGGFRGPRVHRRWHDARGPLFFFHYPLYKMGSVVIQFKQA
jgi:hypothetical protein